MVFAPELPFGGFYKGKRVFVTGHTGFKGGWLALWLHRLGASVYGFATDPPTKPSLFEVAQIGRSLAVDSRGDLTDLACLRSALRNADPEVVFHLAAQPLVLASYHDPVSTFAVNIMGTAHVLEAVRAVPGVRSVVLVTTDKVYENDEGPYPRRESDPLGGHDPYSASKAGAEIVAASYRASYFSSKSGHRAKIATVRAGNVIGGGDWASDRLLPDCARAFAKAEPVLLRSSGSVRPWQHVLEPLSGYLRLAQHLSGPDGSKFAKPWNFGPNTDEDATVEDVAKIAAHAWAENACVECASSHQTTREAGVLRLDNSLARAELGWKPRWSLEEAIKKTVAWYKVSSRCADLNTFTLDQIRSYEAAVQA